MNLKVGNIIWLWIWLPVSIGCRPTTKSDAEPTSQVPKPIQVAIVDDQELTTILLREARGLGKDHIHAQNITTDAFMGRQDSPDADVLIFSGEWLGELIGRGWIAPLPEGVLNDLQLDKSDILATMRQREMRWGEQTYVLPLGSPQFVLMYRTDLLEQADLEPPKTWKQYATVVEKLCSVSKGDIQHHPGQIIEPLGKKWAARVLLARVAAYVRHKSHYSTLFDFRTMRPLIAEEPFVRALKELKAAAAFFPDDVTELTPRESVKRLLQGKAAMVWAWPSRAHAAVDDTLDTAAQNIRFAALPGSRDVYSYSDKQWELRANDQIKMVPLLGIGGRVAALTRRAQHSRSAFQAMLWLTGRPDGAQIASSSWHTTLFRQSQARKPDIWVNRELPASAASEYAAIVLECQMQTEAMYTPRITGQDRYLEALDAAVKSVVSDNSDPAEALRTVETQWSQITESLEADRQLRAYHKSIGLNF